MGWFDKNHTAATGASRVLGFSVLFGQLKKRMTAHVTRGVQYPPVTAVPSIEMATGFLFCPPRNQSRIRPPHLLSRLSASTPLSITYHTTSSTLCTPHHLQHSHPHRYPDGISHLQRPPPPTLLHHHYHQHPRSEKGFRLLSACVLACMRRRGFRSLGEALSA